MIEQYAKLGWALVGIPAGSKAPTTFGWQTKATPPEYWEAHPTHNVGILHGLSGTCAIDIDSMEHTRMICEALNIDLDAILASAPRIVGRPDRGKLLFKAPEGSNLTTRKISWPVQGEPRRTEVVFELRAGSVQDVLPPSIHPDTGNPYTWAGPSFEHLPNVPDQFLTIWKNWDSFRPQLMSICPWARRDPPPKATPRKKIGDGESVIDAYNQATPIEAALEAAGYRQIGKRWLSPNSTSKLPGVVVFDDGTAYSHHASDPFDPAHSFDAFEVFCQYNHLGNVGAAVRAAAEMLDMSSVPVAFDSEEDREMVRHGAEVGSILMARPKQAAAQPQPQATDIPANLLTIPGILGDLVDYSAKTSIKRQPQFDVQTALAIGSVVMGRRFISSHNNMPSLFFLNVGKTGSGKEHSNTVVERALTQAGLSHLRGPNGFTSAAGVMSTMLQKPACISIIDEFGAMLESAGNRGMAHRKEALTMMMEAWGRQTTALHLQGYSTIGMNTAQRKLYESHVAYPSLTVLGMTTPSTFMSAISAKDVASGFLNRFLVVESKAPRMRSRTPSIMDVPEHILEWMVACASAQDSSAGNLSDVGPENPPVPVLVRFSEKAKAIMDDYEDIILDAQITMQNSILEDMLNRSREIAMRLSLIVARSLGDQEIGEAAAQWAVDYTNFYSTRMIEALQENMSEGDTDDLRKKVAKVIDGSGTTGMKTAELLRAVPRLGNLKKYERDGLMAMICEDYNIERVKVPQKRGAPAIIYRKSDITLQ